MSQKVFKKSRQQSQICASINVPIKAKSNNQNNKSVPTSKIMKEIKNLKKQLERVKSRENLSVHEKHSGPNIDQLTTKRPQVKQNINKSPEKTQHKVQNVKTIEKNDKNIIITTSYQNKNRKHKIQIQQLTGMKSRDLKLKLSITTNKLKSILTYSSAPQNQINLITAQYNRLIANLNHVFHNYQNKLTTILKQSQQLQDRYSLTMQKSLKATECYHRQKQKNSSKDQQILELRRNLSYSLQMQKLSREQLKKYQGQSQEYNSYIQQLQVNNKNMKQQISKLQVECVSLRVDNKQLSTQLNKHQSQYTQLQQQLNLLQTTLQTFKQNNLNLLHQRKSLLQKDKINTNKINTQQKRISQLQLKLHQIGLSSKILNQQLCLVNQKQILLQEQLNCNLQQICRYQQEIKQNLLKISNLVTLNKRLKEENQRISTDLIFCKSQIDNLSQEVNQLQQSNQRYKNKYFRNKIISEKNIGEQSLNTHHIQSVNNNNTMKNKKQTKSSQAIKKSPLSSNKKQGVSSRDRKRQGDQGCIRSNKKKQALDQIHDLIKKHQQIQQHSQSSNN